MVRRIERDSLGERELPAASLFGIHTLRARENFDLAGRPVHPALVSALGEVKAACLEANVDAGFFCDDGEKLAALRQACAELADGTLTEEMSLDALQGGAGTSLNLAADKVIAHRALQLLGEAPGSKSLDLGAG